MNIFMLFCPKRPFRYLSLVSICLSLVFHAQGQQQNFGTAQNNQEEIFSHQLQGKINEQMSKIDWNKIDKSSSAGTITYTIPVVIHILNNFNSIFPVDMTYRDNYYTDVIRKISSYFTKSNPDTINIINKFKNVAASTQIAFKLATIDPNGLATRGYEYLNTYLTNGAGDQMKINQWPQDRYFNIWICSEVTTVPISGGTVVESITTPYTAAYSPYYDGAIFSNYIYDSSEAQYLCRGFSRYLNLPPPCSYGGYCGDADMIPDTPPCDNNIVACGVLTDTLCDTPNNQNLLISYGCGLMFTYGQGAYMRELLNMDIGKRDSLVSTTNYHATGMNFPWPDLPPIASFYSRAGNFSSSSNFTCIGNIVQLFNNSWNDTIINSTWSFGLSHDSFSVHPASAIIHFSEPGWAAISLTATGNNTGSTTYTNEHAIYVADTTPINADGYYQEFDPSGDMDRWPTFNYYNNGFKWQPFNAGYYDNTCLQYTSFDTRTFPQNMTGTPKGDFDDFFSPVFNLNGVAGGYLNFMTAGATYATDSASVNDTLEVWYSTNHGNNWTLLKQIGGYNLANNGYSPIPFAPLWMGNWAARSIPLPTNVTRFPTIFRFRYRPGANAAGISTGNNFYIDRINFNLWPDGVYNPQSNIAGAEIAPNPTTGNCFVTINDNTLISNVHLTVTDVTGKVVFTLKKQVAANSAKIEIPVDALTAKGLYLVHVVGDRLNTTIKLIAD